DPAHKDANVMGTVGQPPPFCVMDSDHAGNPGDFALAEITDKQRVADIWRPTVPQPVDISDQGGVEVLKRGAQTGKTKGTIRQVKADYTLLYPLLGLTVDFRDQLVVETPDFATGGDSGSLVATVADD